MGRGSVRKRVVVFFGALLAGAGMLIGLPVSAAAAPHRDDVDASVVTNFDGLNHFIDNMLVSGSIEPPEQGLCVGKGRVLESVSSLLAVYDMHGGLVSHGSNPMTLNAFYGYPPAHGAVFGPQVTDPSCYFDAATQRWFQVVMTLETSPATGRPTGVNHIDLAVSQTSDPFGAWSFRRITALHGCGAEPCQEDFPHLGANTDGVFISVNEYGFFTHAFRAAEIYAFSKRGLEHDTAGTPMTAFDTANMVAGGQAGFTVWPAQSQGGEDEDAGRQETEFFLSSNAADEVNAAKTRTSHDLIMWSLSNTESLDTDHPALQLTDTVLSVGQYSMPPTAQQKAGPTPLAQCLSTTACHVVPLHTAPQSEGQAIDAGDARMQQVTFADGMVFGSLGTAVGGGSRAGIEWFAVRPHVTGHGDVHAQVVNQGYVQQSGAYLLDPALAVNEEGVGAIAFSLMGSNDYPSAAFVPFDVERGTGDVHLAAAGAGPDDGLTNYAPFRNGRTRWGDYGAAVVDRSHVWLASEYIAQTCSFDAYLLDPSCGGTRSAGANWSTRIAELALRD